MNRGNRIKTHLMLAAVFLLMGIWGSRPAYGAGPAVESKEIEFSMEDGSTKVETEVLGTIDVALISAILPSDVEFLVNPEGEFDVVSNPGGQIQSPSGFTITNNSVVPVSLEISRVEEMGRGDVSFTDSYAGGPAQNFRLVDRVSEAGKEGNAILVLGREGAVYPNEAEFERYAICPGKIHIPVLEKLGAGESESLQVYGKISADFYGSYRFTVRPMLKISAVQGT